MDNRERLAEKAEVGAQWRNPQNEMKAEYIMQLKTASCCTYIRRQISVALTILILSLPNFKTLPLVDYFGLIVR